MSDAAKTIRATLTAQEEHARVLEMLRSPQLLKQREDAQARRAVATPGPSESDGQGRPSTVGSVTTAAAPAGSDPRPSELRAPPRLAGVAATRVVPSPDEARDEQRRPWILILPIVFASGLGFGAGVVWLTSSASTSISISDVPVVAEAPVPTGPVAEGGSTAEAAAVQAAAPPIFDPSAPRTPGLIGPDMDIAIAFQADRRLAERVSDRLGVPQDADASPVLTPRAAPPASVAPWLPSTLPEPDVDVQVELAANQAPATIDARSTGSLSGAPPQDDPPLTVEPSTPATSGQTPQVALHLPPDLSPAAAGDAQATLRAAGVEAATTSVARFGVAASEVRYFHQQDASAAIQMAERMGAEARDFSGYRPVPEPGTLEVWLAQGD